MKKTTFLLIAAFFVVAGCASNPINQQLYDTYLTRTFNCSKNKCFDATLAALKDQKVPVEKADKEKGTIITEKTPFYEAVEVVGNQYSASGQSFVATHKYYLKITGDKQSSTVAAYRYRLWRNAVEETALNANWCKENVWDPLFKTIQEKIEE